MIKCRWFLSMKLAMHLMPYVLTADESERRSSVSQELLLQILGGVGRVPASEKAASRNTHVADWGRAVSSSICWCPPVNCICLALRADGA